MLFLQFTHFDPKDYQHVKPDHIPLAIFYNGKANLTNVFMRYIHICIVLYVVWLTIVRFGTFSENYSLALSPLLTLNGMIRDGGKR